MYTPVRKVIVLKTRIHCELNTVEFIVVDYISVAVRKLVILYFTSLIANNDKQHDGL